jgi:oligopeptide transport system ATP-binding protein
LSHRILVLYLGRVVEIGPGDDLFADPRHPYTRALLSAVPPPDPVAARGQQRVALRGEPPSPLNPPSGCPFRTRCPLAIEICAAVMPPAEAVADGAGHLVACHRWRDRSTQGT